MVGRGGAGHERNTRLSPALNAIDHASIWVEKPVRRIAGSARLNPLPHAGTISVFLFGVVVVSGLYITLFFEYGHVASYEAVASMENHAIQRVVRAGHRYASAAMVLTTVVHGWRIFAAGRFVGRQRRYRWATGIAAVVLVWLAGVTGYWLVWDIRAQALNEVVIGFFGRTTAGANIAIDHLGVIDGSSGSGFLLFMWFLHLVLTVAIGYFMFRHLRRSNLPWLPPGHMMALMGGAILLVSLAAPVGMLAPASPQALIGQIPLDPFVLFLLPPLLSEARWLVIGLVVALFVVVSILPRLLRRRDPEVIVIDEAACTGCELCVIDCPYQALTMATAGSTEAGGDGPGQGGGAIAVVDEDRCVACGICLGSCAFAAIDLPGFEQNPAIDVAGKTLVIACDRHLGGRDTNPGETGLGHSTGETVVHSVGCAGAISPTSVKLLADSGAAEVQIIGCAPNECRYGIGNTLAAERLSGQRRPHPAAKYARIVAQDWVPSDRVEQAIESPGNHPAADGGPPPARREALVGVGVITALVIAGVALATRAPFNSGFDSTEVRVVVDHRTGQPLRADPEAGPVGDLSSLVVSVDGDPVAEIEPGGGDGRWVDIIDVELDDGRRASGGLLTIAVGPGDGRPVLFSTELSSNETGRVVADLTDVPPLATVADGRRIFNSRTGGCTVCHSTDEGDELVGPSLYGVADVAGTRVVGLSAEQYLRQSILLPDQYIVDGWPAGQMLPIYRDRFTPEQLDAVISYLLTLQGEESGEGS